MIHPWFSYREKIAAVLKGDTAIDVSSVSKESDTSYLVMVKVAEPSKAYALKTLLIGTFPCGNATLTVKVVNADNSEPEPINAAPVALVDIAFNGNPLYREAIQIPDDVQVIGNNIFCITAKEVVQYKNDNDADYYRNFNGIANEVFEEICVEKIEDHVLVFNTENRPT